MSGWGQGNENPSARNQPNPGFRGNISYHYVSRQEVMELRRICGPNRTMFLKNLEDRVFRDNPDQLTLPVMSRNPSCVTFIKQCLFEHYNIPEYDQEGVWGPLRDEMTTRAWNMQNRSNSDLRTGLDRV